jgi:hypothetical protein
MTESNSASKTATIAHRVGNQPPSKLSRVIADDVFFVASILACPSIDYQLLAQHQGWRKKNSLAYDMYGVDVARSMFWPEGCPYPYGVLPSAISPTAEKIPSRSVVGEFRRLSVSNVIGAVLSAQFLLRFVL